MKVRVKFIGMPEPLPGFEDKKEVQVDFLGNSINLFLQVLRCFTSLSSLLHPMYSDADYPSTTGRVAPFGNLRITA